MKRERVGLEEIAAYDNLLRATWRAARGKRHRPDVRDFTRNLDQRLASLGSDILNGRVPYGDYRSFLVHDPKRRVIHAACFADRVLHHAIMAHAEPVLERSLVPMTYACRPGRGVHRAVAEVQRNLQRFPWFTKVDVDGYFPSIDHQTLLALLRRRFKGKGFLDLLGRIIDSHHERPGKGLPIGSLTSQHFANYYLDGADRLLASHPKARALVRYMDDIIWWSADKASARQIRRELTDFLAQERQVTLKPAVEVNRSSRGVTYCGFRIFPGTILLSRRKQRRYRLLRASWEDAWARGAIDGLQLQRAYAAVHAITLHADSATWRKRSLQLHPTRYT